MPDLVPEEGGAVEFEVVDFRGGGGGGGGVGGEGWWEGG